jgi:hypothetical protein
MKSSVTRSFVGGLFGSRDYDGLVWLSSAICGSPGFDLQHPMYGLPRALFLFVESLAWFAQALRSGAWTYFEATPHARQQEMLAALRDFAPEGFGQQYSAGMKLWKDPARVAGLDNWLLRNDDQNNAFLWRLAEQNRTIIDTLLP